MSKRDLLIVLFFVALGAIFFAPVIFGGASLVPFDNLYRFPPWSAFATQLGVAAPHNELVSDLVLENFQWKHFIVESLAEKELPLWNPYLFGGIPFLAAGQSSALYPFNILFYLLPIERAFGIFVALQLVLAAIAMFAFMRVLGVNRFGAVISAVTYAFSAFFVVSTAFPMIISVAAWLPAILACAELIIASKKPSRQVFFALLGAIFIGIQFLAGHIEISIYVLILTAFYSLWRIFSLTAWRERIRAGSIIALMTLVGITLGAVQLIPSYELVQNNFRSGSVTYQDVIGWAYPLKQIVTFFIPDFFGNPTHHAYLDLLDFTTRPAPTGTIFWGVKNYVEAGSYVGILPLVLALVAVAASFKFKVSGFKFNRQKVPKPETMNMKPMIALFATLAIISLLFIFGTPLYAILFFGVPGFNQLHTPFRWVFPYTLSIAALAGIGTQVLQDLQTQHADKAARKQGESVTRSPGLLVALPRIVIIIGVGILIALAASWLFRDQTLALVNRILQSSEMAQRAFDSGRMFYSYEFRNVALFAIFLIGAGIAIYTARFTHRVTRFKIPLWQLVAVAVLTLDLFIIGFNFYPRADTRLLDFTPPAVKFLQQDASLFRITSYDSANEKMFNPNVGMYYGIADIRGYDSIIPKQYADLMNLLAPQNELLYNRIAPFYTPDPFDSPILNLLNVKYVLTNTPVAQRGLFACVRR